MVKGESRRKVRVKKHENEIEYKKGLWTCEEDRLLLDYVKVHGNAKWNRIPHLTGLRRCGKSCRLRWINYLSPNIKRGDFSQEEDDLIIRLHKLLGNRWSLIAGRVPGRTDNQVKNYWNSHLSKKLGISKGKANKLIQTSLSQKHSKESKDTSNDMPISMEHTEREAMEDLRVIEDVSNRSFGEISSFEQVSPRKKTNDQSSITLSSEDDSLIVNTQSLLDFLSEYCLDCTWSNRL